ncbi:sulfite exporter TauE/SafE family protein [bacterium]|nr:sulfite exporter TauE/SafE family protein [bacterium]
MSLQEILLPLLAITFGASVLQGAIGFGFGLVAVAALSLFLPVRACTPVVAILNAPVIVYVFWSLRRSVVWSRLTPVLIGVLVGIPFGVFVLKLWPNALLLRILGVILLFTAVRTIKGGRNGNGEDCDEAPLRPWLDRIVSVSVGAASGALGGAFNTGGPPVIAWVYSRPWTKEQRTATVQAVFFLSSFARILTMASAGLYTRDLVMAGLIGVPVGILGALAGYAIFKRVPRRALEIITALFLVFMGLKLILAPGG